jgi:hypothetical protein
LGDILGDFWAIFGRFLGDFWAIFGRFLGDFWAILTKNALGHILGDFFTNSSGHPARQ